MSTEQLEQDLLITEERKEQLNRIRAVLDRSPECDTYPPDATLGCGWKRDLLDIKHIMEDQ